MDYEFANNTYSATPKDNPKDRIEIEVGDSKQFDFKPQVKLMRWDNEVNFSVRLKTDETSNSSKSGEKIKWNGEKINIEFYDYTEGEGGYKLIWFLKEKPLTNKLEFTIQSKSLDFFYQPPLTQGYKDGYSEEFKKEIVVNETQIKDLDGNVLVERPENVVGSYAVYHQTKGGMNDVSGMDYKTGQAFFIYRPHIIDVEGRETWGILNIDVKNGLYTVEIPQEFLDKAVYPIKSNDTFGCGVFGKTLISNSNFSYSENKAYSGYGGTVTSMSAYGYSASGTSYIQIGLYDNASPTNLVGRTNAITWTGSAAWQTGDLISPASINSGTGYYLAHARSPTNNSILYYDDVGTPTNYLYHADDYGVWSSTRTWSTTGSVHIAFSVYATYTPSGGGGAVVSPKRTLLGVGT